MTWYDTNLVLIQATITGLILALSVQVPLRMGVFSFAGAGAYGIGAYAGAILVLDHDMAAVPTIICCTLIGAVVVLVLGLLIFRLNGLYLAMATVAFDLIISVIAINGGELTGGSTGRYGVITDFTMGLMFAIGIAALVLVACSELGSTGRRVNAVREDPELAASMGIRVRRYRLAAFLVSGALGGCAGCINILVRSAVSPLDIGFGLIVLALTMIIVGGALSWKGALIGAIIFTWLPDLLLGHRRVAGADLRHHRRDRSGAAAARDLRPLRRRQAGRAARPPVAGPDTWPRRSPTRNGASRTTRPLCSLWSRPRWEPRDDRGDRGAAAPARTGVRDARARGPRRRASTSVA